MTGNRALLLVLVVAALSAGAVAAALSAPTARATGTEDRVVGQRETVRLTGPDGTTLELVATVDTGAKRSSIDTQVAERLGIDVSDADTITVRSALGEEERPVVPIALQFAGQAHRAAVSVNDRSDLTDDALLGRDVLGEVLIAPDQQQLTTPGGASPPTAFQALFAARSAALTPGSLLALLPLAAVAIVLLRYVVGVSTLGTFTPVLLTLGFLQVGIAPALVLTISVVAVGLTITPLLRRWRTPRVARLAVLIGVASTLMLSLEAVAGLDGAADSWGAAFPLVVAAGLVERVYEVLELDGIGSALRETAGTLAVALAVTPVLLAPPVRYVADVAPAALGIASIILAVVVGSYRGLRLTELVRFERASTTTRVPA